jgi:predicted exporter
MKFAKYRFILWLVIIGISTLYFASLWLKGSPLNTDILSLLPKQNQNAAATQAANLFTDKMSSKLLFLVGNPQLKTAQTAADIFVTTLQHSDLFTTLDDQLSDQEQQAWGQFYFPYRSSLLNKQQRTTLLAHQGEKLYQNALFTVYSPMSMVNLQLLTNDPFFLFQNFILSLPKPASQVTINNQYKMVYHDPMWYVVIDANLKGQGFSLHDQNKAIAAITQAENSVYRYDTHSIILKTGVLFYAADNAAQAQHEISTIGIGSIIGIVLLMLCTFYSLSPLLLTLFSAATGFIVAFVVTYCLFGSVYLFTLVFGASLIGISVDYSFFYYAERFFADTHWQSIDGLKHILKGITLGLLNVLLVFAIISLAPFPGLRQLAVFSMAGLAMSYATVVCLFPYVLKAQKTTRIAIAAKLSDAYIHICQRGSSRTVYTIYVVLSLIALAGLFELHSADDIHRLQPPSLQLTQQEQNIRSLLGTDTGTNFIIVRGNTSDAVLTHSETLTAAIDKVTPNLNNPYIAISDYIPSINRQNENTQLIQQELMQPYLKLYLNKVGISSAQINSITQKMFSTPAPTLTIEDWLASPVSQSLKFLWLGNVNGQYATAILLANSLPAGTIQQLTHSFYFATYINKADEVSTLFKTYRIIISMMLAAIFLLLLVLLILRYGLKPALHYFLPPLSACLYTLGILGWLHIPFTLFNLLALLLVLGISVDYVIFFAESKGHYRSTLLAILLSTLTTILSFGLLALSNTPVIHYFGLTVFIGILCAFLLAPLATRIDLDHKEIK